MENIQSCWPLHHDQGSIELTPYWEQRHNLLIIDDLLLLRDRIVIQAACTHTCWRKFMKVIWE